MAKIIVFGNEKGGSGKSTTAIHVAIALCYQNKNVGVIDLDIRQKSMFRFSSVLPYVDLVLYVVPSVIFTLIKW